MVPAHRVANVITPYKIDVVQGNFVSKEHVEALQPGMSRQQIRDILGTPLDQRIPRRSLGICSPSSAPVWNRRFASSRSTSTATALRAPKVMPSESEFVASLKGMKGTPKIPPLEASEARSWPSSQRVTTPKQSRLPPICHQPLPATLRWNRVKYENMLIPRLQQAVDAFL